MATGTPSLRRLYHQCFLTLFRYQCPEMTVLRTGQTLLSFKFGPPSSNFIFAEYPTSRRSAFQYYFSLNSPAGQSFQGVIMWLISHWDFSSSWQHGRAMHLWTFDNYHSCPYGVIDVETPALQINTILNEGHTGTCTWEMEKGLGAVPPSISHLSMLWLNHLVIYDFSRTPIRSQRQRQYSCKRGC